MGDSSLLGPIVEKKRGEGVHSLKVSFCSMKNFGDWKRKTLFLAGTMSFHCIVFGTLERNFP